MARILLAEDEESLRELVARALTQDGHDVVQNPDGATALEALSRDGGRYDLLLTDIRMPVMDGIALALAAGRDYPALPILLMTGYADQRERASDLQLLIHDVIAKPFTLATICDAVREALGAKQTALRRGSCAGFARASLNTLPTKEWIAGSSPAMTTPRLKNPSAAARCNRARSAAAPDRRSGGATLRGCGVRAARRSRPAPSP